MTCWTHSLAAEWLSQPQERPRGLLPVLQAKECFVPCLPPGAEPWHSQPGPTGREVSSQHKATWGLSSMSQGHLLEIPLEIQHLSDGVCHTGLSIRDTPSPLPTAGSSTCRVPKTSTPAKPSLGSAAWQSFVDPPISPEAEQP